MNKNVLKKILSGLLVGAMLSGTLAGCGVSDNDKENSEVKKSEQTEVSEVSTTDSEKLVEEELTYPLDADETITMAMMGYHFKSSYDAKDITDTRYWEEWQERLGVKLEMDTYETEDAFKLMLTSGEMPDIIFWSDAFYTGGAAQMISEETIVPLSWDEINEWAPAYGEALSGDELVRKQLTVDGDVMGFGKWNGDPEMLSTNGLIVRGDWLEDLGLDAPTTPDEFLDMLRAFKEEKGAEYPMALTSHRMNLLFSYGFFSSPYDQITSDSYVKDGIYHLGYYEEEYKEVLKFFHTMYEEGLINPDYLTLDQATVDAMLYDGRTGCVQQSVIAGLGAYVPQMAELNPDAKLQAIGSLLGPNGEKAYYGATEATLGSFKAFITTSCENKELAMKVLNYNYTGEGQLFNEMGIEGESYEMVDGVPTYTEHIINNEDGYTMAQMLQQYSRSGVTWAFVATNNYFAQTTSLPEQREAVAVWDDNDRYEYMTPPITVSVDNMDEYSKLSAEVSTYYSEMRAKFISGEADIDAEFDAYIQGLKDKGIDRCIEIMQESLDEWIAR